MGSEGVWGVIQERDSLSWPSREAVWRSFSFWCGHDGHKRCHDHRGSGSGKTLEVLAKQQLLIVCEKVVERHLKLNMNFKSPFLQFQAMKNLAVDSGADHACPVGSFEVAAHDLVKFSVTQTLEYDCWTNLYITLRSRLTMHFSFKHFVLKRSIAFWFLSENLNNGWFYDQWLFLEIKNKPESVVVPSEFKSFKVRAELCEAVERWLQNYFELISH